ncbi:nephronectin a isoform X1 [Gadus morhua]|uniref:Nephronectin a n=1 Tax=Gadus morhua TaxID=8049 RepID=A0A8C5FQR8_GADMO|nr:nephronectin isoform X1 [Gadus morhua]
MELWIKFIFFCGWCVGASADFDGRWPRQMAPSNGLCRYGARMDCCWGWTRRSWGHCQPLFALTHRVAGIRCQPQAQCQPGCKHGDCVGPNKCKCHAGFTGKTCNQDLNECGLKPRPCKHRCMNTYGSYKCYCLNGYMQMSDGTCGSARTCGMANCQYGCEVSKGEVRCQCPSPGLQLGPDGRTCVDVDECATGIAVCPRFRKCINTFGSYICRCHEGFDLQYIGGKYQCRDVDECSSGRSDCGSYATCYNTPGSFKCKCKGGYGGMGQYCKPVPKVFIAPGRPGTPPPNHHNHLPDVDQRRTTTTLRPPVTPKRIPYVKPRTTTISTTTTTTTTTTKASPPKRVTPVRHKPLVPTRRPFIPTRRPVIPTRKPVIPTRTPPAVPHKPYVPPRRLPAAPPPATAPPPPPPPPPPARKVPVAPPTRRAPPATPVDNSIGKEVTRQRGDVHIPRNHDHNTVVGGLDFDIEPGNTADEPNDQPREDWPGADAHQHPESGYLSCSFDQGLCGWIKDKDGDLHWETTADPAGGRFLTIPEAAAAAAGGGSRRRSGRGARLVLPLTPPWDQGNLCLSFRHSLEGHHVGMLQVFVKKGRQYSPAVWGRTGGSGWRHTQITLWGTGLESVILKGERGRGKSGEMAVDDITLRKGSCVEEHSSVRRL